MTNDIKYNQEAQYLKHILPAIGKTFMGEGGIKMKVLSCEPSRSNLTLVIRVLAEGPDGKVMRIHGGAWFDKWLYSAKEI